MTEFLVHSKHLINMYLSLCFIYCSHYISPYITGITAYLKARPIQEGCLYRKSLFFHVFAGSWKPKTLISDLLPDLDLLACINEMRRGIEKIEAERVLPLSIYSVIKPTSLGPNYFCLLNACSPFSTNTLSITLVHDNCILLCTSRWGLTLFKGYRSPLSSSLPDKEQAGGLSTRGQ